MFPSTRIGTHFAAGTYFKEDSEHRMVVADPEEKVALHRNATVLRRINQALMSLVVAGCYEIDPAVQHLAGPYGKICAGTIDEQQLMFDLTACRKAEAAFVELSGAAPLAVAAWVLACGWRGS